jgi:transcriptional regulator with XRE-family HTH domain
MAQSWIPPLEDEEDKRTFVWEGLEVLERRREFLDFLLAVAGKIDKCARLSGKRRLSCLARQANVERSTVQDWLTKGRKPDPESLHALAYATEEPLPRFWAALRWTTPAELAAALDREAPVLQLSAEDRDWLELIHARPRAERDEVRRFWVVMTSGHST